MPPSSYKVQNGCWNCLHSVKNGYNDLFCNVDKKEVAETPFYHEDDEPEPIILATMIADRAMWETYNIVSRNGKCHKWELRI